jgi:hypothetical protein
LIRAAASTQPLDGLTDFYRLNAMPTIIEQLDLSRCPHCKVDRPNLALHTYVVTNNFSGTYARYWGVYQCRRCGGVITAAAKSERAEVVEMYPQAIQLDEAIPDRARSFLDQAINTIHAPAGSIMLSASSVDAMLKKMGYKEGNLYSRIDKAKDDHVITEDMAKWAHAVRLDANDQRHADEAADLPNESDAQRCIDFVMALGQLLFVLPQRVEKGLKEAEEPAPAT